MSKKIDITKIQFDWMKDIMSRIDTIIKSKETDKKKLESISWLVRQSKFDKED